MGLIAAWNDSVRSAASLVGVVAVVLAVVPGDRDGVLSPSTPGARSLVLASVDCGPDEQSALRTALSQMAAEPVTGRPWDRHPLAANFNPCADLSAILVMIEGGTGSSPVQALLFHRGVYLGTATSKAYGFTSLDAAGSSNDTVVLSYRTGQSCTACDDGSVSSVRYRWDGTKVQMLDPPP